MEVISYEPDYESEWNNFVSKSINGTFMFDRNYMEYHSERYEEASLMVYYKNNPLALLPANKKGTTLVSHELLTFGGLIIGSRMTTNKMMDMFDAFEEYLVNHGFDKVRYKAIPSVYHAVPAESDQYALWRKGANLYRRDISSAVYLPDRPTFKKDRQSNLTVANDADLRIEETNDFDQYWSILRENLAKHDAEPAHTVEEIQLLHDRFPEELRLYGVFNDEMIGGAVVYESDIVARTQYIAGTDASKEVRATDYLISRLIKEEFQDKRYFDFGISTEDDGQFLNEGLIYFKETFGARPFVHDFYEWRLEA